MKNLLAFFNFKKIFFFFLLSLILSIFAFSSDFTLEVTPFAQMTYGKISEYIYSSYNSRITRSLLEWKPENLYELGGNLKAGWKNLYVEGEASFGIQRKCGEMDDSDWNNDGTILYIFSDFDLINHENYSASARIYYDFNIGVFTFSPVFEAEHRFFDFETEDGEGWYGSREYSSTKTDVAWNSGYAKYYRKGKLYPIYLERKITSYYAGISFKFKMSRKSRLNFVFLASPYTRISSYDKHFYTKNNDYISFNEFQDAYWKYFKVQISYDYAFTKWLSLNATISGTTGKMQKGDFYNDYNTDYLVLSSQQSGSSNTLCSVRLGLKAKLL